MSNIPRMPTGGEVLAVIPKETLRFENFKGTGYIKWTANRPRYVKGDDKHTYDTCLQFHEQGKLDFGTLFAENSVGNGKGNGNTEN